MIPAIALFFLGGCWGSSHAPQPIDPTPEKTVSNTPAPTRSPARVQYPSPPVEFVSEAFEPEGSEYVLVTTIRNTGTVAAYLDGGCSWKCPVAPEHAGGSTLASGAILAPGSQQRFSSVRLSANACALPLEMSCTIEVRSWADGLKGSEVKTVKWNGQLQMQ
jgi:hypothetical protein